MPRSRNTGHRTWRRLRTQILAANNICAYCGQPDANTVDHIIPVSLGGAVHDPANLQPMHGHCNSQKGNRTNRRNPTSRNW